MKTKRNTIQMLAIITMLIDHIGLALFPTLTIPRLLGRISFPLFAYNIYQGYQHTKNIKSYALRLIILAMISQIPYNILIKTQNLNVIFTLTMGLATIYLFEKHRKYFILPIIVTLGIQLDYGIYGILMIFLFYYFKKDRLMLTLTFIMLNLGYMMIYNSNLQMFSILALPLIFTNFKIKTRIHKHLYYAIYPAHILILILIKEIIQ